jgi:hypothetical protein
MNKLKSPTIARSSALALAAVILAWAAFPPVASGQARTEGNLISFKFGYGYDWIPSGVGDLEQLRSSLGSYYPSLAGLPGYSGTCSWDKLDRIPGYDFELLFRPQPWIAISIGTSYIGATSTGTYGYTYHEAGTLSTEQYVFDQAGTTTRTYKMSIIPARISIYGILPLRKTFDLYAFAGAGFYVGKITHTLSDQLSVLNQRTPINPANPATQVDSAIDSQLQDNVKKESLGLHGGIGADLKLTPWLSLGVEAHGRWFSVGGWEGTRDTTITTRQRNYQADLGWYSDTTSSESYQTWGSLYYFEQFDSRLKKYMASLELMDFEPSNSGTVRNVRRPTFNLSSYGIRLTLQFYFTID